MSGQRKEGRRSARKRKNNVLFAGLISTDPGSRFPLSSQICGQTRFRRLSGPWIASGITHCSGAHRAPQLPLPAVKICDAVDKDYAPRGIIPLPDPEAPLRVSGSCYVKGFSQYTIEIREREVVLSLVDKFLFPPPPSGMMHILFTFCMSWTYPRATMGPLNYSTYKYNNRKNISVL